MVLLIVGRLFHNFSHGDWLVLGSALCIALGIIVSEKASLHSQDLQLLTFYQIIFTVLIPLAMLGKQVLIIPDSSLFWWGEVYCAVLATVVPLFLQLKYQKNVGANKVAIIFSLEALTATFCAWLAGESIASSVIGGGFMILLSAVISDVWQLLGPRKS